MINKYLKCEGCRSEVLECYLEQEEGNEAGLEFYEDHLCFFSINPKTGRFIVPIYGWEN